ncbi:unnamed protein product [Didymodactylos carnosus]|uniref:Vang-like protein n=1 Tax=Didymodactylos carnosus TaxID=1234261 RepID=A0A813S309_9BILA|nr:unnamed protein product [Didymodactylos carnosus]CAF0789152.1 unnamed protein product [Didymodactylos carnosus]CAF3533985.1 unnamed protein product [Didymodactylos carnosus]CAF3573269.1 unnamed protein product [Didymodactylos carnosus]
MSSIKIMEPDTYCLEKSSSQPMTTKSTIANGSTNHSHPLQPPTLTLPPPPSKSSYRNGVLSTSTVKNVNFVSQTTRSFRHKFKKHQKELPIATTSDDQNEEVNNLNVDDERIEVKILPQDNWGETTTAYTSEVGSDVNGLDNDLMTTDCEGGNGDKMINGDLENLSSRQSYRQCTVRWLSKFSIYLVCFLSYITPLLFLILPKIQPFNNYLNKTIIKTVEIDNYYYYYLPITIKLILLFIGFLVLFYRRRRSESFPRIHLYKALMLVLLLLILCFYWLCYVWKLLFSSNDNSNYDQILQYTSSYLDILLFLHYITLLVLEIKCLYPKYVVKIVRSPDGVTKQYSIGSISIQEASVYLLELYYKDFSQYNPWLENAQHQRAKRSDGGLGNYSTKSVTSQSTNPSFKIYNVDQTQTVQTTIPTSIRSRGRPYNERFYDELDYERRVRKRRTKLLAACEDAFTHVRKCHDKRGSHVPMDSREAAQAVFSSMSRSLQKYLRITRQQPYYTRESIIYHLSTCLSYDMSPRAFLERYLSQTEQTTTTLSRPQQQSQNQQWFIICDRQLNRSIHDNLLVVLKYQDIQLMCTFKQLPKIQLKQNYFDHKDNKFILKLNSETSV